MSAEEFRLTQKEVKVAILPMGSLEQHGPNLGLGADTAISQGLGKMIAGRLGPEALVLPAIQFGVSHHHCTFPGTWTIQSSTLETLVLDVVKGCLHNGITNLLIVNGHGGNQATLSVAATRARFELGARVAVMMWLHLAHDFISSRVRSSRYGHACEVEVSLAMWLCPELVKTQALSKGSGKPNPYRWTAARGSGGGIVYPYSWEELTPNGALGDATLASEHLGREIAEVVVSRTLEFLEDWGY